MKSSTGSLPFVLLANFAATIFSLGCSEATTQPVGDGGLVDGGDAWVDSSLLPEEGCDPSDSTRCLLPFPSDRYTVMENGRRSVRLRIDRSGPIDNADHLRFADGFSRTTPIMVGTPTGARLSSIKSGESFRVYPLLANGTDLGPVTKLDFKVETTVDNSAIVARPRYPLAFATTHVAIVTTDVLMESGEALAANNYLQIALGTKTPSNAEEEGIFAAHASDRELLTKLSIAPTSVARFFRFTTRSEANARTWVDTMQAGIQSEAVKQSVGLRIDSLTTPSEEETEGPAAVIRGAITGVPTFVNEDGSLTTNAEGIPQPVGQRDVLFRFAPPRGTGNYCLVLFGHGAGGSYTQGSFDDVLNEMNCAKLSFDFRGWTESSIEVTGPRLIRLVKGASLVAADLLESIVYSQLLYELLANRFAPTFGAATIAVGTENARANPLVGRLPFVDVPIYFGGSLGANAGISIIATSNTINGGVLNVPAAGWVHWVLDSGIVGEAKRSLEGFAYSPLDFNIQLAATQTSFDPVESLNYISDFADRGKVVLMQESVGENVIPHVGTTMLAYGLGVTIAGEPLLPIDGIERLDDVLNASSLTQFDANGDHSFAESNDTPAGKAARAQALAFAESLLARSPRIQVAPYCPNSICRWN